MGKLVGLVDLLAAPQSKRLLICGGRDYRLGSYVADILTLLAPIEIAEGGARGADRWAQEWARQASVPCRTFMANWELHGRAAGPIRNRQMFDQFKPDGIVAFPGGPGTADMVDVGLESGLVWIVRLETV